jgi:hypothetical protein
MSRGRDAGYPGAPRTDPDGRLLAHPALTAESERRSANKDTNESIHFAAPRTRRSSADAFFQLCIWDAAACPVFSLVGRLPSMPSAGERLPPLFGHFAGTTRPSDSLPTFLSRLWLITFLDRPVHHFVSGIARASRFSRVEVPCISGVFDLAGPMEARDIAPTGLAFPMNKQGRHPDSQTFRGSIPRLHVPLSTLRVQPHD